MEQLLLAVHRLGASDHAGRLSSVSPRSANSAGFFNIDAAGLGNGSEKFSVLALFGKRVPIIPIARA